MSILMSIVTLVGIIVLVCVFWWAMIEAQVQAGRENENRMGLCGHEWTPRVSASGGDFYTCHKCGAHRSEEPLEDYPGTDEKEATR